MKTKHTPGPWAVELVKFPIIQGERCFPAGVSHKINSTEVYGRIAEVVAHKQLTNKDAPRMAECEANARLMAAAPDLLRLCEWILSKSACDEIQLSNALINDLERVLNKATGGEK